jgi:single-stranded-DNA-specific exonuclease
MPFRWVYASPEREESVATLSQELGVPHTIAHLLALRGIEDYEQAKQFFRPDLNQLHDPFLMKDMDKAANRVSDAIRGGEKVLVYGDYDVDGTTACSLVYTFLKDFGTPVDYYIPHRYKEGYGINEEGIDYALEQGCSLLVSVDCGITAIEETEYARSKGLDLVICDHHTVGDQIPNAHAVLDPKRPDCPYPFDGLSGAGVAFKLVQAVLVRLGLPASVANKFLDLVCISTASDIVPIVDENRIIMHEGLKILNANPRPGIKALIDLVKLNPGKINTSSIVFSLGPRINAAGRMGDACKAIELLISEEPDESMKCAHQLESINVKRKDIDNQTMTEAIQMIDDCFNLEENFALVLYKPDWHLGVIGIVASRLVDIYHRPAIMLTMVNGSVKGSARSVKGLNIYDAFSQCGDLVEQFGGHEFAAGVTLKEENVDALRARLNELTMLEMTRKDLDPELQVDGHLDLSQIDVRFWKLLTQFEPFGPLNVRPTFVSKDIKIVGRPSIVGKGHLKMRLSHNGSAVFDAIGFNMHQYLPSLINSEDRQIEVAYAIEENYWNGKYSLQLRLKDIHVNQKNGQA